MSLSSQGELLIKLLTLNTRIQKRLAGPLSCHGISVTEYLVLRRLYHAPGRKLRRVDLAQLVGLSPSGVTRLLNPMQKVGLISKEKVERDARISLVTLTDAGENIFKDANISFDQVAQSLTESIGDKDQKNLLKAVELLL
ncbi:MarR family winged helix-turn-helix transcriptional regulator [Marinimicrobium sp. ARAG 43.8]|uniref:MarR family winged helix-turn-helix transcriptional regulator n=1 Tax=Marinimicrobium sp. ARAG 43.8 TaxID=3418719 RepID=UPI003CFA321E